MALTKITPQMFDTSAAGHDFNIDNGTFVVDASANRVGIGTASPATPLHITGITTFDGDGASRAEITSSTANSVVSLDVGGFNGTPSVARDIRFLTNAAANAKTERMRISSAGHFIPASDSTYNIGANATRFANAYFDTVYGTLATAAQTNITSVGTLSALTVTGGVTASRFDATTASTTDPVLQLTDDGVADYDFTFPDTSTIQLGINTTSTKDFKLLNAGSGSFNLDVEGSITSGSTIQATSNSGANAAFQLPWQTSAVALRMRYDANYYMSIETHAQTRDLILTSSTNDATANIRFKTSGTGASNLADRMVIDHNGNVGIGADPGFPFHVTTTAENAAYVESSHNNGTFLWVSNSDATTGRTANLGFAPANNVAGAIIIAEAIEDFSTSANRTADLAFQVRHNGTLAERWRIHSDGPLVSGGQTPVAIGGTPADANFAEFGAGYINLARDDTADADQILFAKNGAIHSKLQTINNAFVVHSEGSDIHFKTNQGGTARNINFSGSAPSLKPFDSNNGQIDLGTANAKFRSLYVNYLGPAADLRYLKGVYRKAVNVNRSFVAIFKVNGSALGSQFRFSVVGTTGNVVVNARYEILVNHSYDCTVQSLSGSYTETKVKVVSDANEDCTVYLAANTYNNNTASLNFEVETYHDEQISFDVSSPHTTAHFIHTATAGENTTFTGAMTTGAGTTTGYS